MATDYPSTYRVKFIRDQFPDPCFDSIGASSKTHCLRWTRLKCLLALIVCIPLLCIYVPIILYADPRHQWYSRPSKCVFSDEEKENMTMLLHLINYTLDVKLGVSFFLCFGTLWGSLRSSSELLPWDNSIDVCVLDIDLVSVPMWELVDALKDVGVHAEFSTVNGVFHLRYKSARGYLTVYSTTEDWASRTGLGPVFLPGMYPASQFPSWMLQKPLPQSEFLGAKFSVPRGQYEIMMHLYPDDWWKVTKPPGCS